MMALGGLETVGSTRVSFIGLLSFRWKSPRVYYSHVMTRVLDRQLAGEGSCICLISTSLKGVQGTFRQSSSESSSLLLSHHL